MAGTNEKLAARGFSRLPPALNAGDVGRRSGERSVDPVASGDMLAVSFELLGLLVTGGGNEGTRKRGAVLCPHFGSRSPLSA